MAESVAHQHNLGDPWTNEQIEQMIKGLLERNELDVADAIVWLRFELARRTYANTDDLSPRKPMRARWRSIVRPFVD
jgi:hypothetical protein